MRYRISELAKIVSCQTGAIRFYEKEGLLRPGRTVGNYRDYNESDLERLRFIMRCRQEELSIKEIRTLLDFRDNPKSDCSGVHELIGKHLENIEAQLEYLENLKRELEALSKASGCQKRGSCSILEELGAVDSCASCAESKIQEKPAETKLRKRKALERWLAKLG